MNTIPFHWNQALDQLPEGGWDWMLKKGIEDYENNIKPNLIGGLQVIVPKKHQGKGYSKRMIKAVKALKTQMHFENLVIPIRPILKHQYPEMKMVEYLNLRKENKIFDPWIRTHVDSGASIIKVCSESMTVSGDLTFWKKITDQEIKQSGSYLFKGALNPTYINLEGGVGTYLEENIWICYP